MVLDKNFSSLVYERDKLKGCVRSPLVESQGSSRVERRHILDLLSRQGFNIGFHDRKGAISPCNHYEWVKESVLCWCR
jgi:hypothetical protein